MKGLEEELQKATKVEESLKEMQEKALPLMLSKIPAKVMKDNEELEMYMGKRPDSSRRIQEELKDLSLLNGMTKEEVCFLDYIIDRTRTLTPILYAFESVPPL